MTAPASRYRTEPVAVIVEAVTAADPAIAPDRVAQVVGDVLATRALQRRVARVLTQTPTLLTSCESGGPPRLASLIAALAEAGARGLSAPRCAACRRVLRLVGLSPDGRRVCSTCHDKNRGSGRACAQCHRVARVSAYDASHRPLCARCSISNGRSTT